MMLDAQFVQDDDDLLLRQGLGFHESRNGLVNLLPEQLKVGFLCDSDVFQGQGVLEIMPFSEEDSKLAGFCGIHP